LEFKNFFGAVTGYVDGHIFVSCGKFGVALRLPPDTLLGSLRDLADDVGMLWYYEFVYWSGSQATHASPIAVASYLDIAPDGTPRFNMGLSGKQLGGELAVCCDLEIRGLQLLNEISRLGIESLLIEMRSEYKSAFGGDPFTEMTEG